MCLGKGCGKVGPLFDSACNYDTPPINLPRLFSYTENRAKENLIDPLENLEGVRLYIYQGRHLNRHFVLAAPRSQRRAVAKPSYCTYRLLPPLIMRWCLWPGRHRRLDCLPESRRGDSQILRSVR